MQTLAASQAPQVPFNETSETLEHVGLFGRRHPVTTGLVWGFWGGRWGGTVVADGQVTLTGSATNHLVALRSTGAVSVSTATTNWNNGAEYIRLYRLITNASAVTTIEDHRAGPLGIFGPPLPPPHTSVASAATLVVPIGQRVLTVTGTTGITSITATGHSGAVVTLIFAAALTVTDGGNLRLNGNFTTTADDTLTLACDGTNWFEVTRSPN